MKNLSTIPRFSLFWAITILITIVVYLAGFTGAEMPPGYHTYDHYQEAGKEMVIEPSSPQEKIVNSQQTTNSRGDDDELSEQKQFANYFKNLQPEGNLDQQMKRYSENFKIDSIERDPEAEKNDYEYNDNEYYHFDIKRDGDVGGSSDETVQLKQKENLVKNKPSKAKNDKEDETIEMLNFSQTRSKSGTSDSSQNILKNSQSKTSSSLTQSNSLKMSDLKENSGISEKGKSTKEESDTSVSNERSDNQKLSQPSKEATSSEDKDTSKLKESKVETVSEKKEDEGNLKENTENLAGKNAKENAKSAKNVETKDKVDQEEKPAKLNSDTSNGEEVSEKSSEGENTKLVKSEKDNSKLTNKLNSEDANKSEISQNDNKVSLVSNDIKDTGRLSGIEEEDKDLEEASDTNIGVRYYQGDMKLRKNMEDKAKNFEYINEKQRNMEGASRARVKDIFTFPVAFEIKTDSPREFYKNQDLPKNEDLSLQKLDQPVKNSFHLNFPASELENTEYHKNYIKSLKRYKGLEDSARSTKENFGLARGGYYLPLIARENQPLNKKLKIRKRKSKLGESSENQNQEAVEVKKNARCVETKLAEGASKEAPEKNEKSQESNRLRRKSPQKFEYKIKIINEPTGKSSDSREQQQKRKKKDIKLKIIEEKPYKKNPYSQVLLEDLAKLNHQKNDRSLKRRESTWFGEGQFLKSDEGEQGIFKIKGLPSGYYTNRVKFGNKHFLRNEESQVGPVNFRNNWIDENSLPSKLSQASLEKSWSTPKLQEVRHDPGKRFAGNNIFNAGRGNSLLLVKKGRNGERITKTFTDETKDDAPKNPESEELARILSQDGDYIVLKKTDNNKYQKVNLDNFRNKFTSNREFRALARSDLGPYNFPTAFQEKPSSCHRTLTRLHRSSDQKSHNPNTISTSLKKTFEKFKDLADFFKDSEQDTQDNQQQTQELKEGSDIVFSEDKLPDPLIINNEVDEKNPKLKSQNTITSISTNFKQLDQDKKDDCKDLMDSKGEQWKPALKNAFPEAKSVSSVMKDGKEIILIDLNKHELMMNHKSHNMIGSPDKLSKPLIIPGNRQVEIIWNPNPGPTSLEQNGNKNVLDKKYPLEKTFDKLTKFPELENKAGLSGQPLVTMPLNDLAQLSLLLKQLNEKKESVTDNHNKILTKKNALDIPTIKASSNIAQFLRDYRKLSEIDNEQLSKKISIAHKRDSDSYFSKLPKLSTFSDNNVKDLRDFLETPENNENQKGAEIRGNEFNEINQNFKGWENEEPKSNLDFSNPEKFESNLFPKRQGQWTSAKENRDHVPFKGSWNQYTTREANDDFGGLFKIDGMKDNTNGKDYQEELLKELSEASNKIAKLRREGVDDKSLRKTMENALPFKVADKSENIEKEQISTDPQLTSPDADTKDSDSNLNERNSNETPQSNDLIAEAKTDIEKNLKEESPVNGIRENNQELLLPKNDVNELAQLSRAKNFDNFEFTELVEGRRDGVENERILNRRKRSSKKKVSTTEVQNSIISNFTEDNYQSVYSPGIRRKLLSIDNSETERYFNADRTNDYVSASTCAKNVVLDYNDPVTANCQLKKKNFDRTKRSLPDNVHSNHKREIDLDESMPNDFQDFLETSLGLDSHISGVGGQKREILKREETKKENKKTVEGKNDLVAEIPSGEKVTEDSLLEKREISDDRKDKNLKERSYFDYDNKMGKTSSQNSELNPLEKLRDRSDSKIGSSDLDSEKLPTQIRIQITKATAKENKASKPIFDENDITSNEMENPSKEKELFEKNKLHSNNAENLYSTSKFKNPYSLDYGYDETDTDLAKQKFYMMAHPLKKKSKRKFSQDNSHASASDLSLNQKIKEDIIRKYVSDQNLYEATTQRVPASNHLPQVETVYNPTQGANKAQVKGLSLSLKENKNANNKNSLQPKDISIFDDKVLKFYIQDKHDSPVKNVKDESKDLETLEWKPYLRKMKQRQESNENSAQISNYKNSEMDSVYPDLNSGSMIRKSNSQIKRLQQPYNNFLNIYPSSVIASLDSSYDPVKQKSDIFWNAVSKETSNSNAYDNELTNTKDKSLNSGSKFGDASWKDYSNYYFNNNPNTYKFRNYISSSVMNALSDSSLNSQKYLKSLGDNEVHGTGSHNIFHNFKDSDFVDNIKDQYSNGDDVENESQIAIEDEGKKESSKLYTPNKYKSAFSYKVLNEENTFPGNAAGGEVDEDYEGNNEDNWDDYSLLSSPDSIKAKKAEEDKKLAYYSYEPIYSSHIKANKIQQGKNSLKEDSITNKKDEKLNTGAQSMAYAEHEKGVDPFWNSLSVLKMANENSNVLGKNLMKNLRKYNYDNTLKSDDKVEGERSSLKASMHSNFKEPDQLNVRNINWPNKYKRSQGLSKVGNRYIYATKSESFDLKNFKPKKYFFNEKNKRGNNYQLHKSNPLSAELRGMENEFEDESEDDSKYFDDNILSGKENLIKERSLLKNNGASHSKDIDSHDKIKRNSIKNTESLKENAKDGDEKISEDSVLENVIGKYIMRKSVKVNSAKKLKNNGFEPVGVDKKRYESSSDEFSNHKLKKRSTTNGDHFEKKWSLKNRQKRLSSGHLTENNFRKYHKKNFTRKRRLIRDDTSGYHSKKNFKERFLEKKRCARGMFKKLSKEKENKKVDMPDPKTAGFEPILWDSRGGSAENTKLEENSKSEKMFRLFHGSHPSISEVRDNEKGNEKSSTSQLRGPWKIRLNEKGVKVSKVGFDQNEAEENMGEGFTSNGIQAYLLIRNNVRAAESNKMSEEDSLSPTSGASEKEVGSSYRLFHEGGEENLKKRSGRSSLPKTQLVASAENSMSSEDTKTDLEFRKNFLEEHSKDQAPFDSKKNAKFVNANEQRLRFGDKNKILSNRRLRKSVVLPLSTDENIIGDNRHINEETSKNLGQQIVYAILTHVSTNPRFKQVIAPGLSGKSPSYRQVLKSVKTTSNKIKYPDQVQTYLQTIMRQIEKMAENDVKKRMCNKIDRQSKDFLRSMLEFPEVAPVSSCKQKKGFFVDPSCPETCPQKCSFKTQEESSPTTTSMPLPSFPMPPALSMGHGCGPALKASICEALKKKKEVLKKLIEDYQRLSELEREAINVSFQFLVAQLEETEQLLEFLNGCGECYHPTDVPATPNPMTTAEPPQPHCCPNQENSANIPLLPSQAPNDPNLPPLSAKNFSRVFHFEPEKCPVRNCTSSTPPTCECSTTASPCCQDGDSAGFENVNILSEPQSFDLLPNQTNSCNSTPFETVVHGRNANKFGSTRVKESLSQDKLKPAKVQNLPFAINQAGTLRNYMSKEKELHKLGIGDAAGLQLAHENRAPWISNLDVTKQKKVVSQNNAPQAINNVFSKAIKNFQSTKNSASEPKVKDSKNSKIKVKDNRNDLSDTSETKTSTGLISPNIQVSVNHFSEPQEGFSRFEDENSSDIKKIRKKRRTMRYNVKKKNKRNIINDKIRKLMNPNEENSEFEEDPEMEYLIWASMPAVRRRLNDLEMGIEVDKDSAHLLLGKTGGEKVDDYKKEKIDRFKFFGLKK